jgi:hypothetical protein
MKTNVCEYKITVGNQTTNCTEPQLFILVLRKVLIIPETLSEITNTMH